MYYDFNAHASHARLLKRVTLFTFFATNDLSQGSAAKLLSHVFGCCI